MTRPLRSMHIQPFYRCLVYGHVLMYFRDWKEISNRLNKRAEKKTSTFFEYMQLFLRSVTDIHFLQWRLAGIQAADTGL